MLPPLDVITCNPPDDVLAVPVGRDDVTDDVVVVRGVGGHIYIVSKKNNKNSNILLKNAHK